MISIDLVLDCRNGVGESPLWVAAEHSLYWVDIVGSSIHRFTPATAEHTTWSAPELPTSIGLRKDGGFIVGLRNRVCLWKPGEGFETFVVPEPDREGNRLNEGVVAPDGSFWVGTMCDNIGPQGQPMEQAERSGALYRITADGRCERVTERRFTITNTLVWPGHSKVITADTLDNKLYEADTSTTPLVLREILVDELPGYPDGSTLTADNILINARAGGGGLALLEVGTGALANFIALPMHSPTACAFGGPKLGTLFVTSARFGLDAAALRSSPEEGGILAIRGLGNGIPTNEFGE
ncbi:MAG: SMP-30/gluconolactonase/LRE family protein [Devosia indica]